MSRSFKSKTVTLTPGIASCEQRYTINYARNLATVAAKAEKTQTDAQGISLWCVYIGIKVDGVWNQCHLVRGISINVNTVVQSDLRRLQRIPLEPFRPHTLSAAGEYA